MFTIRKIVQPATLEEAYTTLMSNKTNTLLGGCLFLKMGSKRIGTAVDLANPALGLKGIREHEDSFEIGAMTTFRDVETFPAFQQFYGGILPKSVSNIIGVQFRNSATVGASVFSKYGFSDILTTLLALDTEVELFHGGRMTLQEFLDRPYEKDILTKVWVKKNNRLAAYQSLRNSATDYAVLNVAVSEFQGEWKIVVGARPQRALLAAKASETLTNLYRETNFDLKLKEAAAKRKGTENERIGTDPEIIETIGHITKIAAEELSFGTNMRGSAEYRRAISSVLIKRAILEVLQCKSNS